MQIFRGSERDLKDNFGLSPIAVVWIGVLRGKGIFVTEPLLEMCRPGGPLENLLKDRSILAAVEKVGGLETLQAKHDPERQLPLVLLPEGTGRVLALEDEVAADAGWKNQETLPAAQSADLPMVPAEMEMKGLEGLFSKEEVAKLKLAIATTVKPDEKIEAIRKMALAQVPASDKGILFLHALGDSHLEVRREAACALRHLGFAEALVESIHALNSDDDKQREYAVSSLSNLFPGAGELEKGAALQILLTTLRDKGYRKHHPQIAVTLARAIPHAPMNTALFERIMVAAVEALVSEIEELYEPCTALFSEIIRLAPDPAANFLWNEVEKTDNRRLRALLLVFLEEARLDQVRKEEMARKMAGEFGFGDELDPIYLRLANALTRLGETACTSILERFSSSNRVTERMQLVKLLDILLSGGNLGPDLKEKVVQAYANAYPTAPKPFRMMMLESPLLEDPDVSEAVKADLARETLIDIHKEKLDHTYLGVKVALCRMKKSAIAPILKALQKPLHPEQGKKAAAILGDLLLGLGAEEETLRGIVEFCQKQIEVAPEHRGELFKVLGKIAVSESAGEKLCEEVADYLLEYLCKTVYPYDVLEALGFLASAKATPAEMKIDICYLFTTLMDQRLPENIYREKLQGAQKEKIFEFDFKTTAYTDLLPCLITGLTRMAVSPGVSPILRQRVIHHFLEKWEGLCAYRMIWGPKNTTDLAVAMRDLCVCPDTSVADRERLLNALYGKLEIFSVMELLTTIFQRQGGNIFPAMACQISRQILEFANHRDYSGSEDREIILRCIGQMMESERLAVADEDSENLRERMLYTLFEGLRDQIFGVRETLERLQRSPNLPDEFKKEIAKRMPAHKTGRRK